MSKHVLWPWIKNYSFVLRRFPYSYFRGVLGLLNQGDSCTKRKLILSNGIWSLVFRYNHNKKIFKNAPPYMDNLALWKRVPLIYHTKGLPGQVKILYSVRKLDGVGPVDNRPSTDKLHHFVQKKNSQIQYQVITNTISSCDKCSITFRQIPYPVKTNTKIS